MNEGKKLKIKYKDYIILLFWPKKKEWMNKLIKKLYYIYYIMPGIQYLIIF